MSYTRELARIKATQKAYEYRHHGRPFRTQAISFEEWMLQGIRKYEALGADFELIETGMIKITWPGKAPFLRTVSDFEKNTGKITFPEFLLNFFFSDSVICCAPL